MSFMYGNPQMQGGMQPYPTQTFSGPQQSNSFGMVGGQQQQQQQQPPMPFAVPTGGGGAAPGMQYPGMGSQIGMQFQAPGMMMAPGGGNQPPQPFMPYPGMQYPQMPSPISPQQPQQPPQPFAVPGLQLQPQQSGMMMAPGYQPATQQQQPSMMMMAPGFQTPQQQQQQQQQPSNESGESMTWIDQKYMSKDEGYYMGLDEAMKVAGFLDEKLPDGTNNYLPELTTELTSDIETRRFTEQQGMTLTEARAVAIYTYDYGAEAMANNPYYNVNRFLYRSEEENVDKYLCFVIHLLRGMRKLIVPDVPVLYRAVKDGFTFDASSVGQEFTWESFTSTTSDGKVVGDFAKGGKNPVVFEIHGRFRGYSVRSLSFHPEEEEIILEPGARLRVLSVADDPSINGKRVAVQIIPTPPVLEYAVQYFTEKEKKEKYHIYLEEIQSFRLCNVRNVNAMWNFDINVLGQCATVDQVITYFNDKSWFPDVFTNLFNSGFDSSKLNMLAMAFTRMFMPTLSEIKDGVAAKKRYGICQYSQYNQQYSNIFCIPGIPCGISTKIPEPQNKQFPKRFIKTFVTVGNTDTTEIIKQIHVIHTSQSATSGFRSKIACLNMGSQDTPGGGWKTGGNSLEELLFMRTTLSASLEDYLYPMKNLECIYTKDVTYIRNGRDQGCRFLGPEERFSFDVVTTCAFNLKKPVYEGKQLKGYADIPFTQDIENITYQKIRAIFSACAENGADVLILGALGCGAYSNPPDKIAMLFKRALQEFSGVFSYVYFSIYNEAVSTTFAQTLNQGQPENGYYGY